MMDKNMDEVYSIENDMKNFSNNNEIVIPIYGESYLRPSFIDLPDDEDDRDSIDEIIIPPHDPDKVIPRLINYYQWRILRGLFIFTAFAIGLLIPAALCFVLAVHVAIGDDNKIKSLVSGGLLTLTSLFLLLFLCNLYMSVPGGFNWMKKAKKIIKLDGTTWHCQLNSLKMIISGDVIHPCIHQLYNRLEKRPHGYILVSDEGFAIDELTAYQYDATTLVRADIINNPTEKGWIIRIFFVTSPEMKDAFRKCEYDITPVDLYMSPSMQIDEVIEIYQFILSTSHKYLLQSQFLGNPPVKRKPLPY